MGDAAGGREGDDPGAGGAGRRVVGAQRTAVQDSAKKSVGERGVGRRVGKSRTAGGEDPSGAANGFGLASRSLSEILAGQDRQFNEDRRQRP